MEKFEDPEKQEALSSVLPPEIKQDDERLKRALSSRQVSMIAIGGTIGTGLFLGTGRALSIGGPASLVINYALIGGIVYLVMLSLGEMTVEYPVAGSFSAYSARFVDDAFGFSIGWNYAFNDAISVAADVVAAQLVLGYWTTHLDWLASLFFLLFVVALNLIHVKFYGELEYWLSLLKVLLIVIFFFLGIAVNAGGNKGLGYIGAKNWHIADAPFVGGFGGFARLFVSASFAYGGTESIGITAGETRNPSRTIPRTIRRVFWRILLFYILTTIIIGFNVPYNYPNLSTKKTATSPFTIVFAEAGSKAAGSFVNTVILTSTISAANHALFAGSRVLYGLAVVGQAPRFFLRTNRNGVPWTCVLAISSVSLIFFGSSFLKAGEVFNWCQALVGVSNQLAWLCIGVASLRFRLAWRKQGRSFKDLKYPNPAGWFAAPTIIVSVTLIILVQGWTVFSPFDATGFVQSYIELPIFALLYVGWRLIKRVRTPKLEDIDLDSFRHYETEQDIRDNEEITRREGNKKTGWLWKLYSVIA